MRVTRLPVLFVIKLIIYKCISNDVGSVMCTLVMNLPLLFIIKLLICTNELVIIIHVL